MKYLFIFFLLFSGSLFAQINRDIWPDNYTTAVRVTKINSAEAIFEPFFDPAISGFKEWKISDGKNHGLNVWQFWAYVSFEWTKNPVKGIALDMNRDYDVNCSKYDKLLVSAAIPICSKIEVIASTDKGIRKKEFKSPDIYKKEFALDLDGAKKITNVRIILKCDTSGVQQGWFNWVGLQNSEKLKDYLDQWTKFDPLWDGYLQPESYNPKFVPQYGLIADSSEMEAIRKIHNDYLAEHKTSPFLETVKTLKNTEPEKYIREYVTREQNLFNREREHGEMLTVLHYTQTDFPGTGYNLAVAAILTKDKALLRLAARYALSIAACTNWEEGAVNNFPGSMWNPRCFSHTLYCYELAMILDLAGDEFTWLGREFLLRRIAEEGLGAINWVTMKYEYIYHCNQLGWFSMGRMAGSLALEKTWPRAKWMAEQSYKDIIESINYVILPDGGYVEGPVYFQPIAGNAGLAMYMYAKNRNKKLEEVIPDNMLKTSSFAEVIISTNKNQDVIPFCDATEKVNYDMLAIMATALPNSQWRNLLNNKIKREGGIPASLLSLALISKLPKEKVEPLPFVHLTEMNVMSSHRKVEGEDLKIVFLGNKAHSDHNHEDKGSFIIEFAGDNFAMDPGTCDYANPLHHLLKHCQRHNMLVPFGIDERPAPTRPVPYDLKLTGIGDAKSFNASINATQGWDAYYKKWERSISSSTPEELVIKDDYELIKGKGVEFYWNTKLAVKIEGNRAIITGNKGKVELLFPKSGSLRIDDLPLADDSIQKRIVFKKDGMKGSFEIKAKFLIKK